MREVPFSIPVSGAVCINEGSITVTINKAETKITFEPLKEPSKRLILEPGVTLFDIVLEVARNVIGRKGVNRFTAAELYHEALERYPELKRNSFAAHVIASAPNHTSYKHCAAKRDYFSRIGPGMYKLNDQYIGGKAYSEGKITPRHETNLSNLSTGESNDD